MSRSARLQTQQPRPHNRYNSVINFTNETERIMNETVLSFSTLETTRHKFSLIKMKNEFFKGNNEHRLRF